MAKRLLTCFYCGGRARRLTRDHVIPQALGGGDQDNLVDACAPCNVDKAHRLPTQEEIDRFIAINGIFPYGDKGEAIYKHYMQRREYIVMPTADWRIRIANEFEMAFWHIRKRIEERAEIVKRELGIC